MEIRTISSAGYNLWANYVEGENIPIPVCAPTVYGDEWGQLSMTGRELKPSMRAQVDTVPCGRVIRTYPLPK